MKDIIYKNNKIIITKDKDIIKNKSFFTTNVNGTITKYIGFSYHKVIKATKNHIDYISKLQQIKESKKMKLNKKHQLSIIKKEDNYNHAFDYIHRYDKNTVEVTNAHYLARIPVDDNVNSEFYLPTSHKDANDKNIMIYEPANEETIKKNKIRFPNTDAVMPNGNVTLRIAINVDNLYKLSKILGDDLLELQIISNTKAIIVKPKDKNNKSHGLLMPVRLD